MMRRGIGRVGRPGIVGMAARTAVVAGTATAVVGGVKAHQTSQAQQAAAAAQPAPAPAPEAAPPEEDTIAMLKQIAELHDQGILTDEEFAVQKAKLLG